MIKLTLFLQTRAFETDPCGPQSIHHNFTLPRLPGAITSVDRNLVMFELISQCFSAGYDIIAYVHDEGRKHELNNKKLSL